MPTELSLVASRGDADQHIELEQYKMLVDSIHKINDTRELSNNFWVGANGLGVSGIAYLRDAQHIHQYHKSFLLATLLTMGMLFCVSWLSYLATIKKSIETRSELLVKLEENFPLPIFSQVFSLSAEKAGKAALTVKEMLVPLLFLGGYFFFAILLFFFPAEVASGF